MALAQSSSVGIVIMLYKKGKVLPYSLPSVGPGADPGEQAISPQVTLSCSMFGQTQCCAGPIAWNLLPETLCDPDTFI